MTSRPRVLIIDDEPALASTLGILLRDQCEVTVATSGREGLDHLLAGEDYDAILCDLAMPGISGMDIHRRLHDERPGVEARMIFMTGGTYTPAATRFVASIANDTVSKPFDAETIEAAIKAVVARHA